MFAPTGLNVTPFQLLHNYLWTSTFPGGPWEADRWLIMDLKVLLQVQELL